MPPVTSSKAAGHAKTLGWSGAGIFLDLYGGHRRMISIVIHQSTFCEANPKINCDRFAFIHSVPPDSDSKRICFKFQAELSAPAWVSLFLCNSCELKQMRMQFENGFHLLPSQQCRHLSTYFLVLHFHGRTSAAVCTLQINSKDSSQPCNSREDFPYSPWGDLEATEAVLKIDTIGLELSLRANSRCGWNSSSLSLSFSKRNRCLTKSIKCQLFWKWSLQSGFGRNGQILRLMQWVDWAHAWP